MTSRRVREITLWAPDDYLAEERAWRSGWGDLGYAARRLPVPALVQLGVLAHAPWQRLDDLRRAGPASQARRVWGTSMLDLVDRLLILAGTSQQLAGLQRAELVPLERRLLNGMAMSIGRAQLICLVCDALRVECAG